MSEYAAQRPAMWHRCMCVIPELSIYLFSISLYTFFEIRIRDGDNCKIAFKENSFGQEKTRTVLTFVFALTNHFRKMLETIITLSINLYGRKC